MKLTDLPERLREYAALTRICADELEGLADEAGDITADEFFRRFEAIATEQDRLFDVLDGGEFEDDEEEEDYDAEP